MHGPDPSRQERRWIAWAVALLACLALAGCIGDLESKAALRARVLAVQADAHLQELDTTPDSLAPDATLPDAGPGDADGSADTLDAVDAADSVDVADTATGDAGPADTGSVCPGGVGCPCGANAPCTGGACFDTSTGRRCAAPCGPGDACPPAEVCVTAAGVTGKVCAPRYAALCNPCKASKVCATPGSAGGVCVDRGDEGAFCGTGCQASADCPADYECQAVQSIEGQASKQCVRKAGPGGSAVCPCSDDATNKQASTLCAVTATAPGGKLIGTCKGERYCDIGGLTMCDAPTPTAEVCDGQDNDCDSLQDEDTCDDGNPCTQDACTLASGCTHTTADGMTCSDGMPCTEKDICKGGTCAGTPKVCESTPCQDGVCDATSGTCGLKGKADGSACDDGSACTSGDACAKQICKGAPVPCDDGIACTTDGCDVDLGCVYTPSIVACNDANACTEFDQCKDKACVGIPNAKLCDDNNPCTTDTCGAKGCVHTALAAGSCEDGNPCTTGDACVAGTCVAGKNSCQCTQDGDCQDDGNPCNGKVFCDTSAQPFACKIKPGSVVTCVASADPCKVVACAKASGLCETGNAANGTACSDGSVCTDKDTCQGGSCVGGAAITCDDGNSCTLDTCDATKGCVFQPSTAACDDGNACTSGDVCDSGKCVSGTVKACAVSGSCTKASCDPASGQCVASNVSGPCDDGKPCTVGDSCQGGSCVAGPVKACDDGSACTSDSCDAATGACKNVLIPCDDNNACTDNTCDAKTGCSYPTHTCPSTDACAPATCDKLTGCGTAPISCKASSFCWNGTCGSAWATGAAAGDAVTCARLVAGSWSCWGLNTSGQVGTGSKGGTFSSPQATKVDGAADGVDLGKATGCAIGSGKSSILCWGANGVGQCGNGGTSDAPTPGTVSVDTPLLGPTPPSTWKSVSVGGSHACAVGGDGSVYCWGDNTFNQLGRNKPALGGLPAYATSAGQAANLSGIGILSAGGAHTCAATSAGDKLWCWGQNDDGQCGLSGKVATATQVNLGGIGTVLAIAAGGRHTCLIAQNGSATPGVVCFGQNDRGQCSPGQGGSDSTGPTAVKNLTGTPVQITAGDAHTCVRMASGAVYCWGANDKGQVGNGQTSDPTTPQLVAVPKSPYSYGWKGVVAGWQHTCAVRDDGTMWCWGSNASGALGIGSATPTSSAVPVMVPQSAPK